VEKGLRVAYVVVMFPCYSETFVLREVLELKRRGVEVSILSLRSFTEKIVDERAKALMPDIVYCPYLFSAALLRSHLYFLRRRFASYVKLIAFLFRKLMLHPKEFVKNLALFPKSVHFARLMETRGVRHVHAHFTNYPAMTAYIIARLTGIPFTMTAHAHDIFQNQLLLCEKAGAARRLFAISEYNRGFILNSCNAVPPDKVEVVHCGINVPRFSHEPGGEPGRTTILSVGRLMAIKGFDTLITACAILRSRGMDIRCTIVGDGPDAEKLRRLISRYDLEGVVELVGELKPDQVLERMRHCSIFVLASRPAGARSGVMDGIPVTLMEAMAIGVPVVSCNVSGIPELVHHEETGLLVPPADEEGLANAIARLAGDEALRQRLSRAARERLEKEFNIEKSVDRLLEVFDLSAHEGPLV
jgi:colanic acid/amylovoran biosynthesis glycosyltransferase